MKSLRFLALAAAILATASVHAVVAPGQTAPDFTLTDATGAERSLADFRGNYVVLEWHNHECPFVKKHYSGNMQEQQKKYTDAGVVWLGINSSAPGKQGHVSAEQALAIAEQNGADYSAYLFDTPGDVGRAYGARTTPHMFIIDPAGEVVYAGGIDSIKSTNVDDIAKARQHVALALDEALAGQDVSVPVSTPYGCSVKY